jgi:quinol monooxygenase YgiN
MTSLLAFAGPAVLQSAAAVRDTVIMKQVGGRGLLDTIAAIASIAMLVSVILVALVVARLLWSYRTTYKKVNSLLDRLNGDLAPLVRNANSIADNVNFVTTSIRTDVQKVSDTIDTANDRVQQALSLAEHRLNEFNALLSVVQDEADPNRIWLYEVYRDQAAFEEHLKAPHYTKWRDTVKDWYAQPTEVARGSNIYPPDAAWQKQK